MAHGDPGLGRKDRALSVTYRLIDSTKPHTVRLAPQGRFLWKDRSHQ